MQSPPTLILASTSAYRRELLCRVYPSFECRAPGIDETPRPQEDPRELVRRLALGKALAVAQRHEAAWVIGSDQAAVLERSGAAPEILGKPGSAPRCQAQLRSCSGQTLCFLTAVAVVRHGERRQFEFTDTTRVSFRVLDEACIERYVAHESPLDCAGGFKSEGLGISLCRAIESRDPTALIGLPLIELCRVLRDIGFQIP